MSKARSGGRDTTRSGSRSATALGAVGWLSLAAAPTFAIMAVLMAVPGRGRAEILCSAGHQTSSLSGMVIMYVLMSVFHSTPWLRLVSGRRTCRRRVELVH